MADQTASAPLPIAVLDTNVKLDIFSLHDVLESHDEALLVRGGAALHERRFVYKRARARESLLLAVQLHRMRATTFSLHHEQIELLTGRVPHDAVGGRSLPSDFVTFFLHFVKDYVLPDWNPAMPREPGTERSNEADAALIEAARELGVPLITNEGYSQDGVVDEKLRKRARDAGVPVFTPREFWSGKLDEQEAIEWFLSMFAAKMPSYLAERERDHGKADLGEGVLKIIHGYYRLVLRGESEHGLIAVTLSSA
jgi:hypothetical protein